MTIEVSTAEYDRLISRLEGLGFLLDCIGTAMEGNSNKRLGKGLDVIRYMLIDIAEHLMLIANMDTSGFNQ